MLSINRTKKVNRSIITPRSARDTRVVWVDFSFGFTKSLNPMYPNAMLPMMRSAEISHLSHPRNARTIKRSVAIAPKNQFNIRSFINHPIRMVLWKQ